MQLTFQHLGWFFLKIPIIIIQYWKPWIWSCKNHHWVRAYESLAIVWGNAVEQLYTLYLLIYLLYHSLSDDLLYLKIVIYRHKSTYNILLRIGHYPYHFRFSLFVSKVISRHDIELWQSIGYDDKKNFKIWSGISANGNGHSIKCYLWSVHQPFAAKAIQYPAFKKNDVFRTSDIVSHVTPALFVLRVILNLLIAWIVQITYIRAIGTPSSCFPITYGQLFMLSHDWYRYFAGTCGYLTVTVLLRKQFISNVNVTVKQNNYVHFARFTKPQWDVLITTTNLVM